MLLSKFNKFINVWLDGFDATLHGWDCIALALKTDALSPDGSEIFDGNAGRTATMSTGEIAAKHKYFICFQTFDKVGRKVGTFYVVLNFHG